MAPSTSVSQYSSGTATAVVPGAAVTQLSPARHHWHVNATRPTRLAVPGSGRAAWTKRRKSSTRSRSGVSDTVHMVYDKLSIKPLLVFREPRGEYSGVADKVPYTLSPGLWDFATDALDWADAGADPMREPEFLAALSDLEQVGIEAADEGFDQPLVDAVQNADRLLRDMYRLRRCRFDVYPTQDREVAVSAPGGPGRSVLVLCGSDGGVLCSVNLNGQHRRAVYDAHSAPSLPDGFVREALAALDV